MLLRNTLAFSIPYLSKYRVRLINTCYRQNCSDQRKIMLWTQESDQESQGYQPEVLARILVTDSFSNNEQPSASSVTEVNIAGCSMWKGHGNFFKKKKRQNQKKCRLWNRGSIWLYIDVLSQIHVCVYIYIYALYILFIVFKSNPVSMIHGINVTQGAKKVLSCHSLFFLLCLPHCSWLLSVS